jgi:hypothetical protein
MDILSMSAELDVLFAVPCIYQNPDANFPIFEQVVDCFCRHP